MNFLKFESAGFIISLGITLLLCGLIMFYVKQRFAFYDNHLVQQTASIKHLVAIVQSNARQANELASASAIQSAEKITVNKENISKIVVSDDEVDSDSESESESESDSSDTEDAESNSAPKKNDSEENIKCGALGNCSILQFGNMLTTLMPHKSVVEVSDMELSDNESDIDDNSETDYEDEDDDSDSNSSQIVDDFLINPEEIKHIEITPVIDRTNLVDLNIHNEDSVLNDSTLNSLDISFNENHNKVNVLDDIHVTKLNDVIADDESTNVGSSKLDLNLKDLSKKSLQDLCKERNIQTNGSRTELIKRLSVQ